jgi:hypothetical protein
MLSHSITSCTNNDGRLEVKVLSQSELLAFFLYIRGRKVDGDAPARHRQALFLIAARTRSAASLTAALRQRA